jgi:hypothetical protein
MQFEILSARLTLDDHAAPSFVLGPTLDGPRATMSVTDVGAGVAGVRVELDGRLVAQTGPGCRPPFVEPVPCPARRDVSLPVDVASLPDGDHSLLATAVDAAGNASSAPIAFTTRAGRLLAPAPVVAPPVSGAPVVAARARAWFSGKSRAVVRTLKYGERAVVEGTLADAAGEPVANAPVAVSERVIGVTSSRRPASVRTDADGRFSYRLGAGPSRVIDFSSGAATARVTARVRAGVTLRTSRQRVRNGSTLRFSGRVLGRQRALVTIYALSSGPRKRIPVETVRAGSSGRFSYTYRFARIPGPSVYRFEARVPKQTGFPYLAGSSPRVTVRGRP